MKRGEVWWTAGDERFALVVLSVRGDEVRGLRVVEAANVDLTGIALELVIGAEEGVSPAGVLRVALPQPGRIMCSWLYTVDASDLTGRAGMLAADKLVELDHMLEVARLDQLARLSEETA